MDDHGQTEPALDGTERALLATWRATNRQDHPDPVERRLLEVWARWRARPATCPPWAAALRHRITADPATPIPATGLATRSGVLPEASSRLLGMLLGGVAAEQHAQLASPPVTPHDDARPADRADIADTADDPPANQPNALGQRGSALLFVLDGMLRAHTRRRRGDQVDPLDEVVVGLQRWMCSRGVPWLDCGAAEAPTGWLIERGELWSSWVDEPTLLTALGRITAGARPGTRQQPLTSADSATAVPFGAVAPLWSADVGAVFALGGDLAALTHGHADGHNPAAVFAVTMARLLRGQNLETAVDRGIAGWKAGRAPLRHALRLGRESPEGLRPRRAHLDAMSAGADGLSALCVAFRVAVACHREAKSPTGFVAAVESAAEHSGAPLSAATLCGQVLGAVHGPTVLPREWLARLPVDVLERLATDAITEFGPHPDETPQWELRYPTTRPPKASDQAAEPSGSAHTSRTHEQSDSVARVTPPGQPGAEPTATTPRATADSGPTGNVETAEHRSGIASAALPELAADRFRAAVLGCAIGEALGLPIVGDSLDEIRARHGSAGLTDYIPAGHPSGRIGSDTQLMSFALEGTLRANVARRRSGVADPAKHVQHAYQRWLHTQHLSWHRAAGEFREIARKPDGWLVTHRALFHTRNPGRTMMRTLIAFAKGQQPLGTPEHPVSDSQGKSAVLPAVPAALWTADRGAAFRLATRIAALTHGNPVAYLSAGTMAFLVAELLTGQPLATAVTNAQRELGRHADHDEVSRQLATAVRLVDSGPSTPEEMERRLGAGWYAGEALGLGVYAALAAVAADSPFTTGLSIAVNHAGNSATVGAICGSLLGANAGTGGIANGWTGELELHEVLDRLATDAVTEFGANPPDWGERYPGT